MVAGAEASDHFGPWLGLIGVVVGLAISEFFAARREATKRKHEDAVRFHDERLNAYVAYMAASSSVFAAATVWARTGIADVGGFAQFASDRLGPYNAAFWRVSMLVKEPLLEHLKEVHSFVESLTADGVWPVAAGRIAEESLVARKRFSRAAKAELGIE